MARKKQSPKGGASGPSRVWGAIKAIGVFVTFCTAICGVIIAYYSAQKTDSQGQVTNNLATVTSQHSRQLEEQRRFLQSQLEEQRQAWDGQMKAQMQSWQKQVDAQTAQIAEQERHSQKQSEAQQLAWQGQFDSQKKRIAELEDSKRLLIRSLDTAENVGAIKQSLLSVRKEVRDLWSSLEERDQYSGPSDDDIIELLFGAANSVRELAAMADRNADFWKRGHAPKLSTPEEIARHKRLSAKEKAFNELIGWALSLGIVEQLPETVATQHRHSLNLRPPRSVFRIKGETLWWTAFQDIPEAAYLPSTIPSTQPLSQPTTEPS